jgi:hypothetical protein
MMMWPTSDARRHDAKAVEAFDKHFRALLKKADGRSNMFAA